MSLRLLGRIANILLSVSDIPGGSSWVYIEVKSLSWSASSLISPNIQLTSKDELETWLVICFDISVEHTSRAVLASTAM